jgi:transposase-like protein
MMSDLITYNDGELELKVSIEKETVWLNRSQLAKLFDRDVKTVGKHISNIFKEEELTKVSTVANFEIVQIEGNREVSREIEHYSLDVIISVGYRVKSYKGVRFRQWATTVLKSYITNNYVINNHKITEQRLLNLENDVGIIKSKIQNNQVEVKQGVFFDGQIFDAYVFVANLIQNAKKSIILIDNYIDETILTLFSKNQNIDIIIYTYKVSRQLQLDIQKYNKKYRNLTVKNAKNFHDRFLIIDTSRIYHIGASLKDLGKKTFAFSELNISVSDILEHL